MDCTVPILLAGLLLSEASSQQEAGCAHGQPAKAVPNDSSAARVLRFIKVVRILKILRLLKGFKFME